MKLKIISNGHLSGTKIVDADTGEAVENVVSIVWFATMHHDTRFSSAGLVQVIVEFADLAIDAEGELSQMTIEEFNRRMAEEGQLG